MEIELPAPRRGSKTLEPAEPRLKTPLRMNYEAQTQVLKVQIGDLEQIREKLGLSQRKMAQLLMVDPSAWTRWVKTGQAPPHVYRSLQWYLALREKIPGLSNEYFLAPQSNMSVRHLERELKALKETPQQQAAALAMRIQSLEQSLISVRRLNFVLAMTSLILILSLGFRLLA
ncbi:MAG: hypothetical protein ACK5P7_07820 [Bdellovibrio sp.]|jgi:transcriptional regulator with XRE-family HTH domain